MCYFVCKEAVVEGEIVKSGPFVTDHEARMAMANEVEAAYEADSTHARRDIQAEVDEAVRAGHKEITDAVGNIVYAFSIEHD